MGGVAYLGAKAGTRGAMNPQAAEQGAAEPAPAPPAAPAPAAVPAGGGDVIEQLQKLATLHESGALSDEEFAAAKSKALG